MSNKQNAESGVKPAKKRHSFWWLWLILILAAFAGGVIAGLKLNTMPLPTEVKDKIYPVLESYIPGSTTPHTPDALPVVTPEPTAAPVETPAPEVTPEPVEEPASVETPAPELTPEPVEASELFAEAAPEITPEPAVTAAPEITAAPTEMPVPDWMTKVTSTVNETEAAGTASVPASKYIGVDAALEIALKHAEIAQNEAEVSSVYRTKDDDGTAVYEVVFRVGEITRDYTIDAVTGEILSWMVSGMTYSDTATFASNFSGNDQTETQAAAAAAAPEMIGEDRAAEIAMAHAGVKEADVLRSNVQLDEKADPVRYAVEFRISDRRFDYQIDAVTGEILSFELR